MRRRFEGRRVLVTGGARGMGASHARGFAAEGAVVVVTDVVDTEGRRLADSLPGDASYHHLDVTDEQQWASVMRALEDAGEGIDVLVANAGVGGGRSPLVDTPAAEWRRVLEVNLTGSFLGVQAVAPSMRRAGGGAIVIVSSTAGLIGTPLAGAYTTSKWALRGLMRVAALELGPYNIRVNSVHPGYIDTPLWGDLTDDSFGLPAKLALPRMGASEEVTRTVLFAASEEAGYTTGTEFAVDGGWSAGSPVPIIGDSPFGAG